jgi:hypothetical protein
MKRPNCVVCNQRASHVVLFEDGNNNFKGSAVCDEHKGKPTDATSRETLITRIEGFFIPDNAVCDPQADGIPAGGSQ